MSSRAADVARPDGSDPAPEGTETERRLETERVDARTSEGAASSATASGRVSANMTTLTTWVGTWNVGNVAPRMDAVTQWLAHARGHDLVAVAAQEASYPHSRANLRPEAVWAETLAAQRGGDAEADVARAAARLAAADGGSTAHSSDSDDAHDAAGRSVSAKFAKKKRGFFGSSKFARASGALAGALAGGVAAGPLAPFGLVAGAAAGYYSSAKVTAELKSRRHWFDVVAAAMGPEYVPVQTATLLQMRLIVFARRDSVTDAGLIESVRVGYQATGLLNAVGNKGGLMVRLALAGGGSVAFVACHLAAHEGERRVAARDESVAAILRGCWDGSTARAVGETDVGSGAAAADTPATTASREKTPSSVPSARAEKNVAAIGPELLACTSHVFVFGDLNYRVDPGAVESSSTSGPGREKTGWGGRWKKSDDAPSGSLVAALAGLAAKSGKDRNADAAFRAARGGPRVGYQATDRPIDRSTQSRVRASDPGSRTIGTDGSGRSFANETGPTSRGRDADAEKNAPAEAATARWVEGWLLVAELAARGDWDALAEGDQLRREISRGRALRAFVEAPLAFAPTFKLEALEALEVSAASERSARDAASADDGFSRPPRASRAYAKKRVPSWCDRVLARSLTPAHACRFVTYASCPGVRSSDHAPVYASCELAFPRASSSTASPRADVVAREETRTRTHARSESASRRLALRIRVTAFRVALEDDEEEETRFPSPRDGGCGGDDVDDDGAPRRPVDSAVARRGRETATETFFKRAASLKTSASSRVRRVPRRFRRRRGRARRDGEADPRRRRRGAVFFVRFRGRRVSRRVRREHGRERRSFGRRGATLRRRGRDASPRAAARRARRVGRDRRPRRRLGFESSRGRESVERLERHRPRRRRALGGGGASRVPVEGLSRRRCRARGVGSRAQRGRAGRRRRDRQRTRGDRDGASRRRLRRVSPRPVERKRRRETVRRAVRPVRAAPRPGGGHADDRDDDGVERPAGRRGGFPSHVFS